MLLKSGRNHVNKLGYSILAILYCLLPEQGLAQEWSRTQQSAGGHYRLSATVPVMCQARVTDTHVEGDSLILVVERLCNVGHTLSLGAPQRLAGSPVTITDRRNGRTVSINEAALVSMSPVGRTDEFVVHMPGADASALLDYARQMTIWVAPI